MAWLFDLLCGGGDGDEDDESKEQHPGVGLNGRIVSNRRSIDDDDSNDGQYGDSSDSYGD